MSIVEYLEMVSDDFVNYWVSDLSWNGLLENYNLYITRIYNFYRIKKLSGIDEIFSIDFNEDVIIWL